VTSDLITSLYVAMLAAFVGFEMIRRVSPLLHTPLMSLTMRSTPSAVVGAIILVGGRKSELATVLGNDRDCGGDQQPCRRFHDHRPHAQDVQSQRQAQKTMTAPLVTEQAIEIIYLISATLFILSLKWLSAPATARRGVFAERSA